MENIQSLYYFYLVASYKYFTSLLSFPQLSINMETAFSLSLLCSQQLNKPFYLRAQASPLSVHYSYEK